MDGSVGIQKTNISFNTTSSAVPIPMLIRVQLIPKKWLKFYGHKILSIVYWIRRIGGRFTSFLYRPIPHDLHTWRVKERVETVFLKVLVILNFILPSILIIYPIGQYYIPFNTSICLEIYVVSIDFVVRMTNFAFTP